MLRVLFLSPVLPWPLDSGSRIRTFRLLEALRGRAQVHLSCALQPAAAESGRRELESVCASLTCYQRTRPGPLQRLVRAKMERWFHSDGLRDGVARSLASGRFDLLHVDELALARALPPSARCARTLHHHKLDVELAEAVGWSRLDLVRLRALEAHAARAFPHHLTCSAQDAARLKARYPWLTVGAVESGVDTERFRPADPPVRRSGERLLFLGSLDYRPNVDAVEHLVAEVLPLVQERRPRVGLDVVGRDPGPRLRALRADGLELVGAVEDVRPHLARAALLVVPLRIGGGTRLKIPQALAMECPVVTTPVGVEGLDLEHERHLLVADGARQLAAAILALLDDPARAARMAREGRRRVIERYRWDVLADRLLCEWERAARTTAR